MKAGIQVATVAHRYARALLEFFPQEEDVALVATQLSFLKEVYQKDPHLKELMENPVFTKQERQAVFHAVVAQLGFKPLVVQFLMFLVEKNRFSIFLAIEKAFSSEWNGAFGRQQVDVLTFSSVDEAFLKKMREVLGKKLKKVLVARQKIDSSLWGGVCVQAGSFFWDGSLKAKAISLEKELMG